MKLSQGDQQFIHTLLSGRMPLGNIAECPNFRIVLAASTLCVAAEVTSFKGREYGEFLSKISTPPSEMYWRQSKSRTDLLDTSRVQGFHKKVDGFTVLTPPSELKELLDQLPSYRHRAKSLYEAAAYGLPENPLITAVAQLKRALEDPGAKDLLKSPQYLPTLRDLRLIRGMLPKLLSQ